MPNEQRIIFVEDDDKESNESFGFKSPSFGFESSSSVKSSLPSPIKSASNQSDMDISQKSIGVPSVKIEIGSN